MRKIYLILLVAVFGLLANVQAQTTYYSKASATNFATLSSWGPNTDGSGIAPTSITNTDDYVIANNAALTYSTATLSVKSLTMNSGSLTINSGTLNIRIAGACSTLLAVNSPAALTVAGGTVNLFGRMTLASGGTFTQSGGNFNVDGNNGGSTSGSVPTGTVMVNWVPLNFSSVNLTGGTFTIVDPHVGTSSSDYVFNFSYATAGNTNTTIGHTFRFGDGVSTDGTTNTGGFIFYCWPGTGGFRYGNLVVNGGATNRNVSTTGGTYAATPILGDLTINASSEFRNVSTVAGTGTLYVGGNILNNGILTTGTAGVSFGQAFYASSTAITPVPATIAQTIGGSGLFRNNIVSASSTANFAGLIFNNTSSAGVKFSNANALLCQSGGVNNTGTNSGILTFSNGIADLNGGRYIHGISTTAAGGTITVTQGGFFNGNITRWLTTTTLTTAATAPTTAITFPFAAANGSPRGIGLNQSAALTTAGYLSASYTDATGLNTGVSFTDAGYSAQGGTTINRRTNASWSLNTTNVTGLATNGLVAASQTFPIAINPNGLVLMTAAPIAAGAPVICGASASAPGTHAAGSGSASAPIAGRTGNTLANLTATTYYVGLNSSVLDPYFTVASGAWQTGATWSGGAAPGASNPATITAGTAITATGITANAQSLQINGSGSLAVTTSTLNITGGTAGAANGLAVNTASGTLTLDNSTINIGTTSQRVTTLSCAGTLNVNAGTTLNVNGNLVMITASTLNQTGGDININGNNGRLTYASTGTATSSGAVITLATGNTTNLSVGDVVTVSGGTGAFAIGTTVSSFTTNTITVSPAPTVALSGAAIITATQSVASSTALCSFNSQLLNLTGGNLTILNPHLNGATTGTTNRAFEYNNGVNVDLGTAHTTRFGNGSATLSGNGTSAQGFNISGNVTSTGRLAFGNLTVNGTSIAGATTTLTGVSSSAAVVTVTSTAGLAVGSLVTVTSGTGAFAANSFISAINTSTTFTVNATPSTPLSGATITVVPNNRQVTVVSPTTMGVLGNLLVTGTDAEFRHNANIVHVAGNVTCDIGNTYTNNGTLGLQRFASNAATPATAAQTVSGAGKFRNSTNSDATVTACHAGITINNSNTSGVTFSGNALYNSSLGVGNAGTHTGVLTFTAGTLYASGNPWFTGHGVTTPATASVSVTAGGFGTGTTVARWMPAGTAGTTITTLAVPTITGTLGTGTFPFVAGNGATQRNRFFFLNRATTTGDAGGTIRVTYNDVSGTTGITPFVDGGYTVDQRTNSSWVVTTSNGFSKGTAEVNQIAISANGIYTNPTTNSRVLLGTSAIPTGSTHQAGTSSASTLIAQRIAIPVTTALAGTYYVGYNLAEAPLITQQSGPWNDVNTWAGGAVPTGCNNVQILANHAVTVADAQSSNTLIIDVNGSLNVTGGGDLTVGCSGKNSTIDNSGTLIVDGDGILTVNGNVLIKNGSSFTQDGGSSKIVIDGNDNGNTATSVASGTPLFAIGTSGTAFASGTVNLNAGLLQINDPHAAAVSTHSVYANLASGVNINANTNHELQFGNGSSTDPGGHVDGFTFNGFAGLGRLNFGNVTINSEAGTNRGITQITSTNAINGNLDITKGSFSQNALTTNVGGNIIVRTAGTMIANGTVIFAATTGTTTAASTAARSVSVVGSGAIKNLATSETGNFTNVTINNTSSTGVTFNALNDISGAPTSAAIVSTGLTFTAGTITTTGTNGLLLGTVAGGTGTLTVTSGGFASGSTYGRFWTAAQTGTAISASADPGSTTSRYPFVGATGLNRSLFIERVTPTGAGVLAATYTDAATVTTGLSISDAGPYVVSSRYDGNWAVSAQGTSPAAASFRAAITAPQAFGASTTPANGNTRIIYGTTVIGASTHQAGTTTPTAQRTALSLSQLTAAPLFIGIDDADLPWVSVASTDWATASTWNKNSVPSSIGSVTIAAGNTVAVTTTQSCANITINSTGTLAVTTGANLSVSGATGSGVTNNGTFNLVAGTINIGSAGLNDRTYLNNLGASLNVSGGTMNLFGNFKFNGGAGSVFTQSNGDIFVDGNNGGSTTNSVASGTNMVELCNTTNGYISGNLNLTGGTITIVDPNAGSSGNAFYFYGSSTANSYDATSNHTIKFGNGVSTDASANTSGFQYNTWPGSGNFMASNLAVDALTGTNRHVTPTYYSGAANNFTITSGEYRATSTTYSTYVGGSLTNNGTYTGVGTLYLGTYLSRVEAASAAQQNIGGSGVFQNSTGTVTANLVNITVNNTNATGITLNAPLTMSGTLLMNSGIINTDATNFLRLGTATAVGTLSTSSVFSNTSYFNGPFARTFAASRTASGTYDNTTLFPIGKGGTYQPAWVNPTTASSGSVIFRGETFTSNAGTAGSGVSTISSDRYEILPITGSANLTSVRMRLNDATIVSSNKILQSTIGNGSYTPLATSNSYGTSPVNTLTTNAGIPAASYTGYYSYGDIVPCTAPSAAATALVASLRGPNQIDASFTDASPVPTGYLVVRYASGATPTAPDDFVSYAANDALGTGTVVASLTGATTFSATGLTSNTTYDFYIYSFNNSGCAGPAYRTATVLTGSLTTCVDIPSVGAPTSLTSSSFTANWSVVSGAVSYVLDVSADQTFTTFLSGFNALSVAGTSQGVTGMLPNTPYFYRVRAIGSGGCETGNSSIQSVCPVFSLPYTENFNATSVPSCALIENNSSAPAWIINTTATTGYTTNKLSMAYSSSAANDTWFFTPGLALTGGVTYTLSYRYSNSSTSFAEAMKVAYGTAQTGASMTNTIADYPSITSGVATLATNTFTPASTGTYYIGFQGYSFDALNLFLDDISVQGPCTAPANQPTSLTFPSPGPSSIGGSFTAATSSPSGYLVVRYPNGAVPTNPTNTTAYSAGQALGTGTVVAYTTLTTFNATGLAPSTQYDFYVYALNVTGCLGGPIYNTTSPLFATGTTADCSVPVPASVNIGPGGDYPSLTALLPFLSGCGIAAPTLIQLQSNYNPSVESYPLTFNVIPGANATNRVTIRPATGAGPFTFSTSYSGAMFDFDSASFVTFDGRAGGVGSTRAINITNTGNAAAIRIFNSSQNNILRFINFKSSNTSTSNGVVRISTTTGLLSTDGTSNNTVDNCGIDANGLSPNGIYCLGASSPADNKSNTISNNEIFNYYSDVSGASNYGILLAGNNGVSAGGAWTISGNSFYQTVSRVYNNVGANYISAIGGGFKPAGAFNITNNKIGGTAINNGGTAMTLSGTATYNFSPINLVTGGSDNTTISGNTIANITATTASTSTAANSLIAVSIFSASTTISNNTLGSTSTAGSITFTGGSASVLNGINVGSNYSANTGTAVNVTGNTMAGISLPGTVNTNSFTGVFYQTSTNLVLTGPISITNNIIGHASAAISNASPGGILGINMGNPVVATITGNTLTNFAANGTGSAVFARGINVSAGTATIGASGSGKNTISNFTCAGTNIGTTSAAMVYGILNTSTNAAQTITNNDIFALRATTTAISSVGVIGILTGSVGSGTSTVLLNKVYDLTNTSTGSANFITGIMPIGTSGTYTFVNNMISLSNASNTNAVPINGVLDNAAGQIRQYYYNSIYVGGSAASGSLNTFAFQRTYNTTAIDIKNNIFQNARTGGTGAHYALGNVNATATTGWTSDNNILNAPNVNKLAVWGSLGSGDKTFVGWKTASLGDASSFSGATLPFVNTATGDLHLNYGSTGNIVESGGTAIVGYTTDYDNQVRPGPAGSVRGGGSAPDIGADEIDGAPLDVNVGPLAVTSPSGQCYSNAQQITISVKNYTSTVLNLVTYPVSLSVNIKNPANVTTNYPITINTGTIPANGTINVSVVSNYDMSTAGSYVFDATTTQSSDGDGSNDVMTTFTLTKTTLVTGTVSSDVAAYCGTSGRPNLTLAGSAGGNIQWQQSLIGSPYSWTNVGTANSTVFTPASNVALGTTYYQALVTCGATSTTTNIASVAYNNPIVTSAPAVTRCGPGLVNLRANVSAGASAYWYASPTVDTALTITASGANYSLPLVTADTGYYVAAAIVGAVQSNLGNTTTPTTTGATATRGIVFVANQSFTLQSAQYYSPTLNVTNTVTVTLVNNATGTTIATKSLSIVQGGTAGFYTMNLNFNIQAGITYRLLAGFSSSVNRHSTGVDYSNAAFNSLGGLGTILSGFDGSATATSYNYFHNIVAQSICISNRQRVGITLTTAPAIALDQSAITICNGSTAIVRVTAGTLPNYTRFSWSPTGPGVLVGGSPNGSAVNFSTTTNGVYTLTASGGGFNGLCSNSATVTVTAIPAANTPVVSNVSLCTGAAATPLTVSNVSGARGTGSVIINFTNTAGDETTSFTTAKTVGSFTLPALPAGATYQAAYITANGVALGSGTFGSEVRLGIKTTGGANVTTTGYQGATSTSTPNPVNYSTLLTNTDSAVIASVLPTVGGTFNVVYYETTNDISTAQDVTFPSTGTLTYSYILPVTYAWYTALTGGTSIATGTSMEPTTTAGTGVTNTNTVLTRTFYVSGNTTACNGTRVPVSYAIKGRPTPTFTAISATSCAGVNVVYTTQSSQFNYIWSVPGVLNTDYQIMAGSVGTGSNTVTLRWLTLGSKTVTVNYNNSSSCSGVTPASATTTVVAFATPSVTIAGASTTCYGGAVTYTATPTNGGTAPSYQWKKDGANVGTNSVTYRDAGIAGGVITCVMTSNFGCITGSPTVTSTNSITLTVTPNTWTGAVSTDFGNGANWCAGVVPTGAANVSIPSGVTNMPQLRNFYTFNNLTLATGATLDLNGYQLTINGALSGAGLIKGSTTSTLIFAGTGSIGTLNMDPTANSLRVLLQTANSTLTLGSALNIIDSLTVPTGTLATAGFLTLKSTQAGTGRIGILSTGTITGNVTVERWLRNVSRRTFRLLSVPTQGSQTIKQAWMENQAPLANGNPGYGTMLTSTFGVAQGYDATSTTNDLLRWNASTSAFEYAGPASTAIASTGGYYLFLRGDRSVLPSNLTTVTTTTLRSNGPLYIGSQSTINVGAGLNTVVGNIYASAIDFTKLQNTNITSFKLWDPALSAASTTAGAGAYQTFSSANGWVPVPGGGSYGTAANTRIESGQAFLVSPTAAGTITFTEYAKAVGSKQVQRQSNVIERFKTNLYSGSGNSGVLSDGNLVVFDNNYSRGVDNYDVIKMNNFSENLGIANSGHLLTLDARPEPTSNDEIQFTLSNLTPQQYSLEFVSENLDPTLQAYLVDNFLGTQTAIALNSTQMIGFTVTSNAASSAANRFKVVFKTNSTLPVTFTTVRANANDRNNTIEVGWSVSGEKDIRHYEVGFGSDGRNFVTKGTVLPTGNGVSNTSYNWIHETPLQGMNYYRIKSVSISGAIKYSTVVRASLGDMSSSFTVAPNPVMDGNVTVLFENQPEGRYNIRLINSVGQVMLTQIANHAGGNSSYRLRIGSTLGSGLYKVEILSPEKTRYVHNLVISNGK